MRIILKIIAAPFVLALTLTVGVLSFIFSLASWAFNILCLLCSVTDRKSTRLNSSHRL